MRGFELGKLNFFSIMRNLQKVVIINYRNMCMQVFSAKHINPDFHFQMLQPSMPYQYSKFYRQHNVFLVIGDPHFNSATVNFYRAMPFSCISCSNPHSGSLSSTYGPTLASSTHRFFYHIFHMHGKTMDMWPRSYHILPIHNNFVDSSPQSVATKFFSGILFIFLIFLMQPLPEFKLKHNHTHAT